MHQPAARKTAFSTQSFGRNFFTSLLLSATAALAHADINGVVVDASTQTPLVAAYVTLNGQPTQTDANGAFHFATPSLKPGAESALDLRVRSIGYQRQLITLTGAEKSEQRIELTPFMPKALYLSVYGIGSGVLRPAALKLIENHTPNALVIDVKGDAGLVGYKSNIPLTAEIGARKVTTVRDMKATIAELRGQGIYTIARIVTFKDNLLARTKPELAIRTRDGNIFQDREGLAWVDPFQPAVWDYNLQLAEEAAQLGFDEVQFDYIRFPDTRGLQFSQENTEANRVAAITGFLTAVRKRIEPYNVFLGADIFGYACWNTNDTEIGQRIEKLAKPLDVISPMLYPSGFQFGIPGYRNPIENSYEIVFRSLKRAHDRTGLQPVHFRPWLQAFRDYAFDRRVFGPDEIQQQITASENFGSGGWMLWNPRNVYSAEAFAPVTRMTMKDQEPAGAAHTETAKVNNGG
jgi:hypothetical protein